MQKNQKDKLSSRLYLTTGIDNDYNDRRLSKGVARTLNYQAGGGDKFGLSSQ
jgi:hypothetical protein